MQCPRCQHDNHPPAKFCQECGARLTRTCAQCSTEVSAATKFCPECGAAATDQPAGPAQLRSPDAYTPRHLAEKILTSRSALEGERKQVTVLFCDVVESWALAERLGPEAMHEVMDRVLRLMAEAVHRYEGTVNQFLGDGLMALFGAPVAVEDHALRATQAALAIQETLTRYGEQLKRERGLGLRLRQGLNTGLVVVGKIGDDLRMDYTAVGDTTHLAARIQAVAEPGAVLLSEATHRLVEGYVRSEALGPVHVKGRSEPVSVYRLIARRRARTRLEASAQRGLTPLVGRQRELALLNDCFARAKAGRGQVVGIVGEPGVGKSRLLYEFRRALEGERLIWLEGHCVPYGLTTPYLPILEILRANFQIEEDDHPLQIQEKLHQGVRQLDPSLQDILPFLQELFGLPAEDERLKYLDPKDKRQKTFEAIRALTVAGSQRRPLVVIVEDLHWIDKTSEAYLDFVIESLPAMRALLVTVHRPGYSVRWANKAYYAQVALDLLSERETEVMVATLLASREVPSELVKLVRERAEGNPLFVEEMTNSLIERGIVVLQNGGVRWAGTRAVEVPATIQDIIRARIDRLEEPIKRTVQSAAVIGREFGLRLLARISEMAEDVQRSLETLKHQELIHEWRFFPELEYIFKHAVTQDVVYQSLLAHRRKKLHGAIGRAIEELYERLDEQAPILAYHYARSEHLDKAIHYALWAGDRAARLFATAEATTYYQQALDLAHTMAVSPDAQRWEIDAAVKLASAGATPDLERDQGNLAQARRLAEELGDEPRLARVLYWLGRIQYARGSYADAVQLATESLDIADRLGDEALAAPPVNLVGRIYAFRSDHAQAAEMLERSVEQMHRLGNKSEEATTSAFAGWVFALMGQFDKAHRYMDRGMRMAHEIQNPFTQSTVYNIRGVLFHERGQWVETISDLEEAARFAQQTRDLFRLFLIKMYQGRAYAMAGDPARGRALVEETMTVAEKIGTKLGGSWQRACLATCLLALGEVDPVPDLCREAIRLADQAGERWSGSVARRLLADTLARQKDAADLRQAEEATAEAIRVQQEVDAQPELARTYVTYARVLQAKGEVEAARRQLMGAIGMFRDMGMAWDLEQAEGVLREL